MVKNYVSERKRGLPFLNLSTKQAHKQENRLVVAKGEEVGEGWTGSFGISRCKLSSIGWLRSLHMRQRSKWARFCKASKGQTDNKKTQLGPELARG